MDTKTIILMLADVLLLVTSLICGFKFLKKRNVLLGIECWVVTVSTSNMLIYLLSGSKTSYSISFFLDAFSRGFGIPVIATAGLMAATHRYKPSKLTDIVWFLAAFGGTFVLVMADFVAKPLPYFYVIMWTAFSIYLAYFASRLLQIGAFSAALALLIALFGGQAIACIYDFYKIPGDTDKMIFFTLALTTWSYTLVAMYHAYCALMRKELLQ